MNNLKKIDFIDLENFSKEELYKILRNAQKFKVTKKNSNILKNKIVGMIFEKPSTRTRVSFEAGVLQLGGSSIVLPSNDLHFGQGKELIEDTAKVLSRYVDAIMMRSNCHDTLKNLAKNASVPVINGLTNFSHPCQILADIMTIIEKKNDIENQIVCWIGDCNNVANSWMQASCIFGFEFRVACPKKYWPKKIILDQIQTKGQKIIFFEDPIKAISKSTVVATDVWISMGDKVGTKKKDFISYQVNQEKMSFADNEAIFLHCLPALRGLEVTGEVIDGPQSLVFEEAENRLHIQKSILTYIIK